MKVTFRENGVVCLRDVQSEEIPYGNPQHKMRNFGGEIRNPQYDRGQGYFTLSLPEDVANELVERGFNVKIIIPKMSGTNNADGAKVYRNLRVNLKYYDGGRYNPKAYYMLEDGGFQMLDQESIKLLDDCRIKTCDIDIYPYEYTGGISARLNCIRVVPDFNEPAPRDNSEDFEKEFGLK